MSNVFWNVDGQRGDLGLHWLHGGLGRLSLHFLPARQGRKCDLDVCAGEPERAPAKQGTHRILKTQQLSMKTVIQR